MAWVRFRPAERHSMDSATGQQVFRSDPRFAFWCGALLLVVSVALFVVIGLVLAGLVNGRSDLGDLLFLLAAGVFCCWLGARSFRVGVYVGPGGLRCTTIGSAPGPCAARRSRRSTSSRGMKVRRGSIGDHWWNSWTAPASGLRLSTVAGRARPRSPCRTGPRSWTRSVGSSTSAVALSTLASVLLTDGWIESRASIVPECHGPCIGIRIQLGPRQWKPSARSGQLPLNAGTATHCSTQGCARLSPMPHFDRRCRGVQGAAWIRRFRATCVSEW